MTWEEVLHDLLDESDHDLSKTDTVEVCISKTSKSAEVFHPDFLEPISVIRQFDKDLKYVTFKIEKSTSSTDKLQTTKTAQNAFSILMGSSECKKHPKQKAEDGLRFTALSCVVILMNLTMPPTPSPRLGNKRDYISSGPG